MKFLKKMDGNLFPPPLFCTKEMRVTWQLPFENDHHYLKILIPKIQLCIAVNLMSLKWQI